MSILAAEAIPLAAQAQRRRSQSGETLGVPGPSTEAV